MNPVLGAGVRGGRSESSSVTKDQQLSPEQSNREGTTKDLKGKLRNHSGKVDQKLYHNEARKNYLLSSLTESLLRH